MTSHYSRKDNPGKKYFSLDLNVNGMYNLYLEKEKPEVWQNIKKVIAARRQNAATPLEIKPKVSLAIYRQTFNTEVIIMILIKKGL